MALCLHYSATAQTTTRSVNTAAQLTTAITEARNGSGLWEIHLSEGEYNLTAIQRLRTGVSIIGAANGGTKITSTNVIFEMEAGSNLDTSYIKNLTLTTDGAGGLGGGVVRILNDISTRVVIDNCNISTKVQNLGGAVLVASDAAYVRIENTIIHDCFANMGGAIYVNRGTVDINHSKIFDNEAGTSGGAVYSTGGAIVNVFRTFVVGNTSQAGGAGFHLAAGLSTLNLTNAIIVGNESKSGAQIGGIAAGASVVNIEKTIITDNIQGDISTAGTFTIDSSIIGYNYHYDGQIITDIIESSNIQIGSDGTVVINLPTHQGNVLIPFPFGDNCMDIGAECIPLPFIFDKSDKFACVGDEVIFTVNIGTATGIMKYTIYEVGSVGPGVELVIEEESAGVVSLKRTWNEPVAGDFIIKVEYAAGKFARSGEIQVIIIPLAESKVGHIKNITDS